VKNLSPNGLLSPISFPGRKRLGAMYLIAATIVAIVFFAGLYIKTVKEFFALLRQVQPVVSGKFKCGFLYSTITLFGEYKGRQVICGLEQLKESNALFVKIKLHEALPEKSPRPQELNANKVMLSGGWLMPRFHFSKEQFNRKDFTDSLDRLSFVCDSLERQMRLAVNTQERSSKVAYKVD